MSAPTLALVPAPRDTLGQVLDEVRLAVQAAATEWERDGGPLDQMLDKAVRDCERRLRPGRRRG